MKRVAIVGGGISGLAAAYFLQQAGVDHMLFEASPRLGGVIATDHVDGFIVEGGPDSFLSAKTSAAELASELGIADQLIHSNDDRRRTYIALRGKLVPTPVGVQLMVPTDPWAAATSRLFSLGTKLRVLRERLSPPSPLPAGKDESVAAFTERHFGREVVERLADPLLAGVYGGDASKLSARAVIPKILEAEQQHGSLGRGLSAEREATPDAKPIFTSFKRGMQQLVDAIVAKLDPGKIRTGSRVETLRHDEEWHVSASQGGGTFTHIILATPAHVSAELLATHPELSGVLRSIRYTSSATVSLLDMTSPALPPGFGVLVPRSETMHIIAATFVHNKFAGRAPAGKQMVRAFLTFGLGQPDDILLDRVRADLQKLLGGAVTAKSHRIARWKNAMPQYEVGHLDRVAKIETLEARAPGLQLIGNAYRGVGVSDCVREGRQAAERIITG